MWKDRCLNREDAILLSRTGEQLRRSRSEVENEAGEVLAEILAHAKILPEGENAPEYVELNDRFTYEITDAGTRHTVMLVVPEESDSKAGKISFVSPVGLAVLGTPVGAETTVELPDGRMLSIRIVSTVPLEA